MDLPPQLKYEKKGQIAVVTIDRPEAMNARNSALEVGVRETFTVRKVTQGIAVERIFPLHSPRISQIEPTRRGRVRRARLFYLRSRKGRSARIREKRR